MEKYYKILDINTNATEQDVKQAYRDLVKVWHPDRFTHDPKLRKKAEEKLKEINVAYQKIIGHLNNPYKHQQSYQYQKTEKQTTQSTQKQRYNESKTQYTSNTQYVKPTKWFHFAKNFYVVLVLVIVLLILGYMIASEFTKQDVNKWYSKEVVGRSDIFDRLQPSEKGDIFDRIKKAEPRLEPLPKNGAARQYFTEEAIAPLKIVTKESGQHYFVKIVDWYSGELVLTIFIRSGQSVNVDLPLGSYKIKYATGKQWYGKTYLFGHETTYNEADKKLDFEVRGSQVLGYTIELFLQRHGNLITKKISAAQF